jgi:hypothetical protein
MLLHRRSGPRFTVVGIIPTAILILPRRLRAITVARTKCNDKFERSKVKAPGISGAFFLEGWRLS